MLPTLAVGVTAGPQRRELKNEPPDFAKKFRVTPQVRPCLSHVIFMSRLDPVDVRAPLSRTDSVNFRASASTLQALKSSIGRKK
jgi:hypothetical protein